MVCADLCVRVYLANELPRNSVENVKSGEAHSGIVARKKTALASIQQRRALAQGFGRLPTAQVAIYSLHIVFVATICQQTMCRLIF
jgi:hypothetical protein